MSAYGLRIENASNTFIAWKPGEPHGTGLQAYSPHEGHPRFAQAGLAFFVPKTFPSAWKKYQAGEIAHADALAAMADAVAKNMKF